MSSMTTVLGNLTREQLNEGAGVRVACKQSLTMEQLKAQLWSAMKIPLVMMPFVTVWTKEERDGKTGKKEVYFVPKSLDVAVPEDKKTLQTELVPGLTIIADNMVIIKLDILHSVIEQPGRLEKYDLSALQQGVFVNVMYNLSTNTGTIISYEAYKEGEPDKKATFETVYEPFDSVAIPKRPLRANEALRSLQIRPSQLWDTDKAAPATTGETKQLKAPEKPVEKATSEEAKFPEQEEDEVFEDI